MCRWFAYLAPEEECLLEDVLITPVHSLAKQVHDHYLPKLISHNPAAKTSQAEIASRNKFFNVDGFGVAWYSSTRKDFNEANGPRPALYKHAQPPNNDTTFHSICENTSTTNVMGHIRSATATPVVPTNNHPFVFGRHAIMHNGVISDFLAIRRDMLDLIEEDAYGNIHGTTDSEHLAALYITCLTRNSQLKGKESWEVQYPVGEMKDALTTAFKLVFQLQQKVLGKDKAEANSLNVCCSDGTQMIGFRYRNHATEQPPSLYWSDTAGITLNRKYPDQPDNKKNTTASKAAEEHGIHTIIASEPTTYKLKEWNLIEKNHAVLVSKDGTHKEEPIEVPSDLNATAKTTQHG